MRVAGATYRPGLRILDPITLTATLISLASGVWKSIKKMGWNEEDATKKLLQDAVAGNWYVVPGTDLGAAKIDSMTVQELERFLEYLPSHIRAAGNKLQQAGSNNGAIRNAKRYLKVLSTLAEAANTKLADKTQGLKVGDYSLFTNEELQSILQAKKDQLQLGKQMLSTLNPRATRYRLIEGGIKALQIEIPVIQDEIQKRQSTAPSPVDQDTGTPNPAEDLQPDNRTSNNNNNVPATQASFGGGKAIGYVAAGLAIVMVFRAANKKKKENA